MQKIIPHLWFDTQAREAAEFYVATFPNSRMVSSAGLDDTPSGSVELVTFELAGLEFQAISAGPLFKFNPSISFHVAYDSISAVNATWDRLMDGGQALMELGAYPFSERFGWVQDRYGLSWQIIYIAGSGAKPKITPVMMFVGDVCGKAEEAILFWASVFRQGQMTSVQRYGKDEQPDQEGTLKYAGFSLFGQDFGAMDSAYPHAFAFNEAISFIVPCETQAEIDDYWGKLSAVPEAEACGWLKDRYGLSWQVTPARMGEWLGGDDRERTERVTRAFLAMKKMDIAALQDAYDGITSPP